MGTSTIVWLFVAAFGASALGGALGMASGIFIVPILTLLFGVDIHVAIGASIVSVIACSCGSAAPFLKERLTNIRLAIVLETATTLGALTGVFLIGIISTAFLYGLFAIILAVSAQQMLARRREVVYAEPSNVRSGGMVCCDCIRAFPIGPWGGMSIIEFAVCRSAFPLCMGQA